MARKVGSVEIFEEHGLQRQQITCCAGVCRALDIAVEVVVFVDCSAQAYDIFGEEIVGGEEWVEDAGVGQMTLVNWHAAGKHLCGTVPLTVDVGVVVHRAVEIVAKHQRQQFAVGLLARGGDHEVAVGGTCGHVHHLLAVERRAEHTHGTFASEWTELHVEHLAHHRLAVGLQGGGVGDNRQDAVVEFGLVALNQWQVVDHILIHVAQ